MGERSCGEILEMAHVCWQSALKIVEDEGRVGWSR